MVSLIPAISGRIPVNTSNTVCWLSVSFELKIEQFQPEFIGKMNFYLEALDRDVRKPHENPSIGVLLCKSKDDEVVEYAMSRNISPTLVADYQTKFIDKKILQQKLHELFGQMADEEE